MDFIEIKPSTHLNFVLPNILSTKFTLYNVTLHQLNLRIYSSHPSNFIITPNKFTMDSFDQKVVKVQLKYYQEASVSNFLANKMVLYIYDYDQQGGLWNHEGITKQKFSKVQKLQFQVSCTAQMQGYCLKQPQRKQMMLRLSKLSQGIMTSVDKSKLVQYLQELGNLQSFHTLAGNVFIAQYKSLNKTVSQIMQLQSSNGQIVLYAVGAQPWLIYPDRNQQLQISRKRSLEEHRKSQPVKSKRSFDITSNPKQQQSPKKQIEQSDEMEHHKSQITELKQQQKQQSNQKNKKQQYQKLAQQSNEIQVTHLIQQQPFRIGIRLQSSQLDKIRQDSTDKIVLQSNLQITQQQLNQVLKQDSKATATTNNKSKRKNNIFQSFAQKQTKTSFSKKSKRRNKSLDIKIRKTSDEILEQQDQEDQDYKALFMEQSEPRIKSNKQQIIDQPYLENIQVINSIIKPLNFLLMKDSRFAILFEGFVMIYTSIDKVGVGEKIELGPSADWNTKKTVIKSSDDKLVISCNWSFYIVDLKKKKSIQGYVQRKQILDFLIHQKSNILILGGITYSKLSLFGKQTGRSNIKTYSLQNQSHLFTFDFPTQGDIYHLGQLGITDTKIVAALGNQNKVTTLYFLNVINPTKIQILSKFQMQQLAVSDIKDLRLVERSIYVLQDIKNQQTPLMFMKKFNIKFQDRPSISTESLPIPHGSYSNMTMDGAVILLADTAFKQLTVYMMKSRKYIKIPLEGKFVKMEVNYPYLFIMYETHIEAKRLRIELKSKD